MRPEPDNLVLAKSFGSVAAHYDRHAAIQKKAADRLVEFLKPFTRFVDGPVLEFGCGTGFITDRTAHWWPDQPREVTDLAPEMVAHTQAKLAGKLPAHTRFRTLDIEQFTPEHPYGLILSGLTVQWTEDLQATLKHLGTALKPGGLIAVSYFNSKSFPQWKSLCREAKVPYTANPLPKPDVATYLGMKYKTLVLNEIGKEEHESPMAFFQHLKAIGAGVRRGKGPRGTAETVQALQRTWESKRRKSFTITYGITYAIIQRLA